MAEDFYEETQERYKKRLADLKEQLPSPAVDYLEHIDRAKRKSTLVGYANDLLVFFKYLSKDCDNLDTKDVPLERWNNLTGKDIDSFVDYCKEDRIKPSAIEGVGRQRKLKNHDAAVNRKIATLRSFFDYCMDVDLLEKNPAHRTLRSNEDVKKAMPDVLKPHERKALMNAVETGRGQMLSSEGDTVELSKAQYDSWKNLCIRDRAIVRLFFATGMRVSELAGLDLDDMEEIPADDGSGIVYHSLNIIRKGGIKSYIYYNDNAYETLCEYLQTNEKGGRKSFKPAVGETALFISQKHCRMSVSAIERMVKKYSYIGFGGRKNQFHAHNIRGTYASAIVNEGTDGSDGGNIFAARLVLGHASVKTTEKYYVAPTEHLKQKISNLDASK